MARSKYIPINFEKIKLSNNNSDFDQTNFLVTIKEKNQNWTKSFICEKKALVYLRDELNQLIESITIAEELKISEDKAKILDEAYKNDDLCNDCEYKLSRSCLTCIFELQSPLERKLYLALKKNNISSWVQYALNWEGEEISTEGKSYDNPNNNFKNVLTIVDFYIHKRDYKNQKDIKLCVYTDGHTYHERTEEQAQRDRRIDRKLQELGYNQIYSYEEITHIPKHISSSAFAVAGSFYFQL